MPANELKKFYCKHCKKNKMIGLILSPCKASGCPLKRHKEQNAKQDGKFLSDECHIKGEGCFCKELMTNFYFDIIGICGECNKDYHICPVPGCIKPFSTSSGQGNNKHYWFADFNNHLRTQHNKLKPRKKPKNEMAPNFNITASPDPRIISKNPSSSETSSFSSSRESIANNQESINAPKKSKSNANLESLIDKNKVIADLFRFIHDGSFKNLRVDISSEINEFITLSPDQHQMIETRSEYQ